MKWIENDNDDDDDGLDMKEYLEATHGTDIDVIFHSNRQINSLSSMTISNAEDYDRIMKAVTTLKRCRAQVDECKPLIALLLKKQKAEILPYFNDQVSTWPLERIERVQEIFASIDRMCRRKKSPLKQLDVLVAGYCRTFTSADTDYLAKVGKALINAHLAERYVESDSD